MPPNVLHRGDLFAGRYRVHRCIGTGGMGAVYDAEHIETERRIALKVLLPQSLVSESARERFKQEARLAAKIRHPGVVDVLDAGVDDLTAMPYLVMELLDGEDLGSRIMRCGAMDRGVAVGLLAEVAGALDCLHDNQIVHRDLKPENLFLARGADGALSVKLLDFGVAKVIADGSTSAFTQDAQGTPVYMAPEQFAERIRISPATDIYALGMLAFTLLTGKHYWGPEIERGVNVFMLARIAEGGPREPATLRASRVGASLPPAFDEWFSTVTAMTPGERYPTATDAIDALADVMGVDLAEARRAALERADARAPSSARLVAPSSLAAGGVVVPDSASPPTSVERPYTSGGSQPSGFHSTPPIPLNRPPRWSHRARVLTTAFAIAVVAIGLSVAFRVARVGPPESGATGQAPAPSSAMPIADLPPSGTPPSAPSPPAQTTAPLPDLPSISADPSTSTAPSAAPVKLAPSAPRSPSSGARVTPPASSAPAPASATTSSRKPKYTRD